MSLFKQKPKPIASIYQIGDQFAVGSHRGYCTEFYNTKGTGETFLALTNILACCLHDSVEEAAATFSKCNPIKIKDIY